MIHTSFKKCPKCQSEDIIFTGSLGMDKAGTIHSNGTYDQPSCPIYKCNKCEEEFMFVEGKHR